MPPTVCVRNDQCGNPPFGACYIGRDSNSSANVTGECVCGFGYVSGTGCQVGVLEVFPAGSIALRVIWCIWYTALMGLAGYRLFQTQRVAREKGLKRTRHLVAIVAFASWHVLLNWVEFLIDPFGFWRILTGLPESFLSGQAIFALLAVFTFMVLMFVQITHWFHLNENIFLRHSGKIFVGLLVFLWCLEVAVEVFRKMLHLDITIFTTLYNILYLLYSLMVIIAFLVYGTRIYRSMLQSSAGTRNNVSEHRREHARSLFRTNLMVASLLVLTLIYVILLVVFDVMVDFSDTQQYTKYILGRVFVMIFLQTLMATVILYNIHPEDSRGKGSGLTRTQGSTTGSKPRRAITERDSSTGGGDSSTKTLGVSSMDSA